jgi:hypothetical protein
MYGQHRYCSNIFWKIFTDSFHVLWPYEFRDCYTRNTQTGQYNLSIEFEHRLRDIKSWTMSNEMFIQYPELSRDIPSFNQIPVSLFVGDNDHNSTSTKRIMVKTTAATSPLPEDDQQYQDASLVAWNDMDSWNPQIASTQYQDMDLGVGTALDYSHLSYDPLSYSPLRDPPAGNFDGPALPPEAIDLS